MRLAALIVFAHLVLFTTPPALLCAQAAPPVHRSQVDTDGDGLSDALEQSLLIQFAPTFMIGRHDCSTVPAEFLPGIRTPKVKAKNGTVYGQAFPAEASKASEQTVELHYYHLWAADCGPHGHPLDAEHVSVLVRSAGKEDGATRWKAEYWYAAAHENTVCDVSQIARAATLKSEDKGASVWISPGKHASFLNQELCHRGCGADSCEEMKPLAIDQIINLGELKEPMNAAVWTASRNWPLAAKMITSDFPAEPLARLETLPDSDIAWFNPGRHPAQGVIAVSSSTADALGTSGEDTTTALSIAGDSTGNALGKSYRNTIRALGTSARHVGHALNPQPHHRDH